MPKKAEPPSDPGMILTAKEMTYAAWISLAHQSRGIDERSAKFYAFELLRELKDKMESIESIHESPKAVFEVGASSEDYGYTVVSEEQKDGTFRVWRRRGDELLPEHLR